MVDGDDWFKLAERGRATHVKVVMLFPGCCDPGLLIRLSVMLAAHSGNGLEASVPLVRHAPGPKVMGHFLASFLICNDALTTSFFRSNVN